MTWTEDALLADGRVVGRALRGGDIDFRQLGTQSFGDMRRCNPPFNYMAEPQGEQP